MTRRKIPLTPGRLFRYPSVLRRATWVAFHRDQRGASYSLSVVLILPFYVAFVAFAVEMTLFLNAHLAAAAGLESAAHATRVWAAHRESLEASGSSLEQEVHRSVARAMVPFAPIGHGDPAPNKVMNSALVAAKLPDDAVNRYAIKLGYVQQALKVSLSEQPGRESLIQVDIEYASPIWFPFFVALLADERRASGPVKWVRKSVQVPMSKSEFKTDNFGIEYSPRKAVQW